MVALDGDALLWFQYEDDRRPLRSWDEMKAMILRRFRLNAAGSLHEQWADHWQTGTVMEYRRRFVQLLAPLKGVSDEVALGQFMSGVNPEIKTELRLHNPRSLDRAMELALRWKTNRMSSSNGPNMGQITRAQHHTTLSPAQTLT